MKRVFNVFLERKIKLKKADYDMNYKDVLALVIACFEVFLPAFVIVGVVIFGMIVFLLNVWIR